MKKTNLFINKTLLNTLQYLDPQSIYSLMQTNSNINRLISSSFNLILSIEKSSSRQISQIIYDKEYLYITKNKEKLEKCMEILKPIHKRLYIINKRLVQAWTVLFYILIVNFIPLVLALLKEKYIFINNDSSNLWKVLIPISSFWLISLIFLILYMYFQVKFKKIINKSIVASLIEEKIFSVKMKNLVLQRTSIKYMNLNNHIFIKYLVGYFLFWIPYILNMNLLRSDTYKNEDVFTLCAISCFGIFYLKGVYSFLTNRLNGLSSEEIINEYTSLISVLDNNKLLERKLSIEVTSHLGNKGFFNENSLSMLYYIMKFMVFVGIGFYFRALGSKIDNSQLEVLENQSIPVLERSISYSWSIILIPIWVFYVFWIVLIVIKSISNRKCMEITVQFLSNMTYFIGFLVGSILFCVKLDGGLEGVSFFVVPSIIFFSSVYLLIHNRFICSYNKCFNEMKIFE